MFVGTGFLESKAPISSGFAWSQGEKESRSSELRSTSFYRFTGESRAEATRRNIPGSCVSRTVAEAPAPNDFSPFIVSSSELEPMLKISPPSIRCAYTGSRVRTLPFINYYAAPPTVGRPRFRRTFAFLG